MLNVTKKEINNKLQDIIFRYDEIIKFLNNNETENGFKSLNELRLANSEVHNYIFNYTGTNSIEKFGEKKKFLNEEYIVDKIVENKINEYQIRIFDIIKQLQEKCIRNNSSNKNLIRLYIERYLPLVWNKDLDLLIICNITDIQLLEELIKIKQKKIFILNQQCDEVNNFIKKTNKTNKELKLVDDILGHDIVNIFKDYKKNSKNIKYCLWYDFPNNFQNIIDHNKASYIKSRLKLSYANIFSKTSDRFKTIWVKNGLENLYKLQSYPNVNKLQNKFSNQSIIIVCPGPSLINNLEDLKKNHKKYFICAVGHSLGILKDHEIIPDMLIHVDPIASDWANNTFNNYDFSKIKLLFLSATCNNQLFLKGAQNIYWMTVNNLYDNWIHSITKESNVFLYSRNVSHIALSLSVELGFKNIGFIGLDHAMNENQYYLESTTNKNKTEISSIQSRNQLSWPSKINGTVKTNNTFINSILSFEKLIKIINKKYVNIKLYNCTSNGALIKGFENISFVNFLKGINYEKNKYIDLFKNYNSNKLSKKKIDSFFVKLLSETNLILYDLKLIIKDYREQNLNIKNLNKFIGKTNFTIRQIKGNNILDLLSQECFTDFQKRKNIFKENEITLLISLFENLYDNFEQFQCFLQSFSVKNNLS